MALPEFIVMFRESLEIAFIIGIMLAYLHKTKTNTQKNIWIGAALGIISSIALAYGFSFVKGGFAANEELFEGFFMVITAGLVTWFILWMINQRRFVQKLERRSD